MINRDIRILIVGLGLMGGSYARSLIKKGFDVRAITKDQESIDYALEQKIITEGFDHVDEETVRQSDLIIFSLYPKIFKEWIRNYQHLFKSGAVITDVTGVKKSVVYEIQDMLREDVEFIAAHPMAGREVYGVENSTEKMFYGANYIVVPTEKNTPEAVKLCEDLGILLGFERISRLTPEKHDEMIGFVSQLTHCIAVSLMTCSENEHLVDYTGDSFRDLTRIARINEDMWSELFLMNKEDLIGQMDIFIKEFMELKKLIEDDDVEKLKEKMRLSTKRRALFDKK